MGSHADACESSMAKWEKIEMRLSKQGDGMGIRDQAILALDRAKPGFADEPASTQWVLAASAMVGITNCIYFEQSAVFRIWLRSRVNAKANGFLTRQ